MANNVTPLRAALFYAQKRKWAVFPVYNVLRLNGGNTVKCACSLGAKCDRIGKHPWTENGFKNATTDEQQIIDWWTEHPNANVGIATGMVSGGLVVIDADLKGGGYLTWQDIVEEHNGHEDTAIVETGSKGSHTFFYSDRPVKSNRDVLALGIDIRADDGYVVAPPSNHVSGEYVWVNPDMPIAQLPDWLYELIKPKREEDSDAPKGREDSKVKPDCAMIMESCAWLRHTLTDAATLSEQEWYWMLSIVGTCKDGHHLAHEFSRPYSTYDQGNTDKKLAHALDGSRPIKCATIKDGTHGKYCDGCTNAGKSPVYLGYDRSRKCRQTDTEAEAPPPPGDEDAPIDTANYICANNAAEWVDGEGDKKGKMVYHAVTMPAIAALLRRHTGGWPRRSPAGLFYDDGKDIRFLSKVPDLFAWVGDRARISWRSGQAHDNTTFCTKEEFFAYLAGTGSEYEGIEKLPHYPPLPRHYYQWGPDSDYLPTGAYLRELTNMFTNVESAEDRALIMAMFLTPAWGGPLGARPAFAILAPDRGCGKTTLSDAVGQLYGGTLEMTLNKRAEEDMLPRLLTPDARQYRVVRFDNVKGKMSSPLLEGVITNPYISGKQMYVGDSRRPNTLTFHLTGNGMRLSRDMAERSFIIRLTKPEYNPAWKARVISFIAERQQEILLDVIHILSQPAPPSNARDRWMAFLEGVLTRCTSDVPALIALNQARRDSCDEDLEEAAMILEAAYGVASSVPCSVGGVEGRFIPRNEITPLYNFTMQTRLSAKTILATIRGHIESGHFRGKLIEHKRHGIRGYVIFGNIESM